LNVERLEAREMLSATGFAVPHAYPMAPAQMRTAYGVNLVPGAGQGQTVAIVDAFDSPNILSDVNTFSAAFGLPPMDGIGGHPTFTKVTPTGQSPPPFNGGWAVEIGLDVQWVHAIAPYANIVLVETQNNSSDSLYAAEVDGQPYASGDVFAKNYPGVSVVSNSYGLGYSFGVPGSGEFLGENAYDSAFAASNVAFTFSTGDNGAFGSYPAYSPNVVAVGGTSLYTLSGRGSYGREDAWSGGGGGFSVYEPTPAYQANNGVNFGSRTIPDISMDADPNTGAIVYYSPPIANAGFYLVGGTSLSSPMFAGVIALANQVRASHTLAPLNSQGILNVLYGDYNSGNYLTDFHDVTTGSNGFAATPGYDLATGIGSPRAQKIVSLLGNAGMTPSILGGGGSGKGGGAPLGKLGKDVILIAPVNLAGPVAGSTSTVSTNQVVQTQSVNVAAVASTTTASVQLVAAPVHESGSSETEQLVPVQAESGSYDLMLPGVPNQNAAPTGSTAPAAKTTAAAGADSGVQPVTESATITTDAYFADFTPVVSTEERAAAAAPVAGEKDGATIDLAMIAGLAVVMGGAWNRLAPDDARRNAPALRR
jgi:hypothetical protein